MTALTITATAPVFTATALGGAQFIGYVCALSFSYNPTSGAFGGISETQLQDSGGSAFAENAAASTILTVGATATSTNSSGTVTARTQKGANLFFNVISVAATCTARITVQALDSASGNFVALFTASFDSITTPTDFLTQMYPGIVTPPVNPGPNLFICNIDPGNSWRAVVSITATASGGGANINYTLNAQALV